MGGNYNYHVKAKRALAVSAYSSVLVWTGKPGGENAGKTIVWTRSCLHRVRFNFNLSLILASNFLYKAHLSLKLFIYLFSHFFLSFFMPDKNLTSYVFH